jgi:hypothetical protein
MKYLNPGQSCWDFNLSVSQLLFRLCSFLGTSSRQLKGLIFWRFLLNLSLYLNQYLVQLKKLM